MIKKKLADRLDWKRLTEREYAQVEINTEEFKGYISLLSIKRVREPLYINVGEEQLCIANNGYLWLQQFPNGKNYSVTTMFDAEKRVLQWYIDICQNIRLDERNVPCFDDLFLDISVFPSGEIVILDADEIEDALTQGVIDQFTYDNCWQETNDIVQAVKSGAFKLMDLSTVHLDILLKHLR